MPYNKTAAGLAKLLADTYAVYLKTHGYHWNVRGPAFASLHTLFMTQYTEMWTAIDEIAERIRALGELAPQGYRSFANLSAIGDGDPEKDAQAMLKELIADHETLIVTAKAAREGADDVTISVIDARVQAHEKHAWMLRASLG
ncbi:Dps family protein [Phenylobacterium kunshanense]|uniref:DNA starvation/stationary phase protection protein n=1 Tax=Phenylobacterium kunshanense TaxID=1445034 RepID=A0A328BRB1_9CAUL|nr:DNA starvation/stationary phase protection protein [Phenylobacterium kunshanense]RAK67608.1 DNA starvation/stationary phase protection protein [Phenylobacterium kunshanense]